MKRLVWGLILVGIGLLSAIAALTQNDVDGVGATLFIVGGGLMAYFGWKYVEQGKQVAGIAIQMIRNDGKVDSAEIAQRMELSEVDARVHIANAQRKGIIPFKAEIV